MLIKKAISGVANISQVVGPDTGDQSPEEGRGIKKIEPFGSRIFTC